MLDVELIWEGNLCGTVIEISPLIMHGYRPGDFQDCQMCDDLQCLAAIKRRGDSHERT